MTSILSEKEYQHFIMDRLSQDNGYIVRKATSYDRLFAYRSGATISVSERYPAR